jgi:hypothetical protein
MSTGGGTGPTELCAAQTAGMNSSGLGAQRNGSAAGRMLLEAYSTAYPVSGLLSECLDRGLLGAAATCSKKRPLLAISPASVAAMVLSRAVRRPGMFFDQFHHSMDVDWLRQHFHHAIRPLGAQLRRSGISTHYDYRYIRQSGVPRDLR